jgi:two-component system, OmpR family, phosphate regulon sensor histidine kinase PhoR
MSAALAGLAVFQVLHIRELFSVQQKQFDANVMQSLHETAATLENREAARLITANVYSLQLDSMMAVSAVLQDSANHLMQVIRVPSLKNKIPKQNFKYRFRQDSLGFSQHFEFSTESEKDLEHLLEGAKAQDDAVQLQMEELQNRLNKKEKQISIVMKKMEQESILKPRNIRARIDGKEIEKALSASLQNRGIKTPYSYAVVNDANYSILFSNDSNAVEKASASVYSTQLFPNDIIPGSNFLTVWFPQKSMFLFSMSDFNLFSSFIFILIVMLCFAYTLVTLVRQKKLSDMKSDFINNMTHELKTPIATISVAADALRDTPAAGETQIKYYSGIIRQENERMNAQVERVLQLARLDKKEMQLDKESVNLHELIHHAAATFSMQVEKSNGTLTEELNAEQPVIIADPLHISNIIHNLLDNAKKYSTDIPVIKIKTWNDAKGVFLSVSDSGIGMNKEIQKKIFDKFYRASKGNIHDVKGFGIGLSYVKEIVELHGGKISVESQPEEGSTFIIFLPYE